MQWENLTSPDFSKAVKKNTVCVIAIGVVERHGDHLPLGTDFLNGHKIACLAAEKEPAVVFPPFYFGQIYEAKCFPGTIAVKPQLLVPVIQEMFDEIGRNGFKKIVIYNAHGGNGHLLPFLAQCQLWEEKPYSVYLFSDQLTPERREKWEKILDTEEHGHACECETSISLANHKQLVKMGDISGSGKAKKRLKHLPDAYTGINWYADYPEHYAGDARTATEKKGKILRGLIVDTLAEFIRRVKKDKTVPALSREFFHRVNNASATPRSR